MTIKAKFNNPKLVESVLEQVKLLGQKINKSTADDIGRTVTNHIQDLTSKGISTVREFKRRMPAYKNPPRYPGKRKPKRPVNLRLTGDFMNALTFKSRSSGTDGYKTEVFYNKESEDKKESGHREGVNGQPKRPTLPQGNERFAKLIENDVVEIYKQALVNAISKIKF